MRRRVPIGDALAAAPNNLMARAGTAGSARSSRTPAAPPNPATPPEAVSDSPPDDAAPHHRPKKRNHRHRRTSRLPRSCRRASKPGPTPPTDMLILGIESSCDDAAAAVLATERPGVAEVRASVVANQDDVHRAYGGIVPELASRKPRCDDPAGN